MNTTRVCSVGRAAAVALCVSLFGLIGCGSGPTPTSPANASARVGAGTAGQASGALVGAATNNASLTAVKSTFRNSLQFGRDPFFPDSRRVAAQTVDTATVRQPAVSYLKLVGIRPGPTRPLALINRTPFGLGEERDVAIVLTNQMSKAEVQKISVRCLEIRRDSVVIKIAGEHGVKELRLAQAK